MAYLDEQDRIRKQAQVTSLANGIVSKSNDVAGTAEVVISQATPAQDTTRRFGGPSATEQSLNNISNKSALITKRIEVTRQINYNNEFLTLFSDESKSWVNDPAIVSARQQVQTATLQLETTRIKISDTIATIDGASPQIAATAETRNTTQDTAARDVVNSTSPAVVESGSSPLATNQLTKLTANPGPSSDRGVIPNVSNKVEPALESARPITLTTPEVGVTAKRIYPEDAVKLNPIPNVLHQYASYTYGLSLHLLTVDEFNNITDKGEYTPTKVLIASAGRYNNTPGPTQFTRSPYFKEDFYFDGFDLDTVIGLNAASRSTNAIKYNFTLIEPYGFTLIDRIINLCNSPEVASPNYLDMPYLLQIDFFGIDDSGQITGAIPNTTKRIPIRMLKMDVKISARGAEYAITGTPFNHGAFDLTYVSTPKIIEVEANTVAKFFQSDESQGDTTDTTGQRESAQGGIWATSDGRIVGPDGQLVPVNTLNQSLLSVKTKRELGLFNSFGSALNQHQLSLQRDGKIEFPDKYIFNFVDPEIANSLFVTGNFSTPKNAGMVIINSGSGLAKDNATKKGDLGLNTSSYSLDSRLFQINPGTYIDQVINYVIRNSTWAAKDLIIPEEGADEKTIRAAIEKNKTQPFYWWKVIPSVKLGKFDNIRKVFSRTITYTIQKYEVRNLKVPFGPQGTAGQAENPRPPVKSYNYIYSGKNDDILDLDITFNATYYTALTTYRNAQAKLAQLATASEAEKSRNTIKNNVGSTQDPNAIMPLIFKPQVADTRTTTGSGAQTAEQVAMADLEASLLDMSQADMLHVKLKIIGDPSLIKQDDLFWTPKLNSQVIENKENADDRLTPDGSIKMDNGEVYVNLTFRTPVDVDETTGMMQFTNENILGPTQTSLFSGLYRILKVKNQFRSGQFTQELELIRLPRQDKLDYGQNKQPTSDERGNQVPGEKAIVDNNTLGPSFATPDSVKSPTTESDDTAQSAQEQQADNRNTPADRTAEQDALVETRALAPEEPISVTNEPVTVPPPPTEITPIDEKLPAGVTQNNVGVYQYKGINIGRTTDANGKDSKNLEIIKNAIDTKTTVTYVWSDPVSGLDKTVTYNGATGQTENIR